ncbi:hypothetical protein M3J07_012015 [Ascochyta lentis]
METFRHKSSQIARQPLQTYNVDEKPRFLDVDSLDTLKPSSSSEDNFERLKNSGHRICRKPLPSTYEISSECTWLQRSSPIGSVRAYGKTNYLSIGLSGGGLPS